MFLSGEVSWILQSSDFQVNLFSKVTRQLFVQKVILGRDFVLTKVCYAGSHFFGNVTYPKEVCVKRKCMKSYSIRFSSVQKGLNVEY